MYRQRLKQRYFSLYEVDVVFKLNNKHVKWKKWAKKFGQENTDSKKNAIKIFSKKIFLSQIVFICPYFKRSI